jgi:error-prone DNA polymerase
LAVSGALEGFGVHRRNALWDVLDPGGGDPLGWQSPGQDFAGLSAGERVGWDYQSMGLSPQAHLLEGVRLRLRKAGYAAASEVSLLEPECRVEYAGLVICRQSPSTAKGVMFLTLEDETGIVNLVVWKGVWTRFRKVILTSGFLGVSGIIQSEEGVVHVVADRFWSPEGLVEPGTVPIQAHDFH